MPRRATVHVEPMTIPTYRFREDPFPLLQREGGRRIYPYSMQDDLGDEVEQREFQALVAENGLLRLAVLPELGGHVLSLRDLVHDREVFYPNVPLKFGLIGLRGAWWAGGIEFNFPQVGHAVTTSDRVSWRAVEGEDGSASIFVGAVEHLSRMAWSVALTLRPDDWRLHVRVRLFNRTPLEHRIYFWSNAAAAAREDFRLLLPATKVFSWWYGAEGDASFPIHKGRDLSRYATFFRSGDVFAKDLRADWFGGYYEELDCGVVHHASRFEVPGRKLFTWGRADDGRMWAELLNERGQPYVELQSGRFVHQGVHRLLAPYASEVWEETWAPVWGLGGVVHATSDAALNAARDGAALALRVLALAALRHTPIAVRQGSRVVAQARLDLAAGEARTLRAPLDGDGPVTVEIGGEKVTLRLDGDAARPALDGVPAYIGVPETPDPSAERTPSTASGWLVKARSSQERGDRAGVAECYRKALELDPACAAAMAGLAQWHLKRGETAAAGDWARKALAADPQHEDALWWGSVASFLDGGEPTAHLHALARSPRYAAPACTLLGELALRRHDAVAALDLLSAASHRNPEDARIVALAAFAARCGGAADSARALLDECARDAPLEPMLAGERHFLASGGPGDSPEREEAEAGLAEVLGAEPQPYLEVACDYERVGAWDAAADWLASVACRRADPARHAMLLYHMAHALWHLGRVSEAVEAARRASEQPPLFIAPHRFEDAQALATALRLRPDDPLAHLLLGNWLASVGRWDEAAGHWQRTAQQAAAAGPPAGQQAPSLAVIAWRNLGQFRWQKRQDAAEALDAYARALDAVAALDPSCALAGAAWRLWLERDAILAARGRPEERLAALESAPEAVKGNAQVSARRAEAALRAGRLELAVELLSQCSFKPWEGEHRARWLWKEAHMQCGHRARTASEHRRAREHFEAAASYPRHLNVGKPALTDDADALFWAGWCALEAGDQAAARRLLLLAANEEQPGLGARDSDPARVRAAAEFKARATELLATLGE